MEQEWINLTPENLASEHLCCIIRSKKPHPGVEAKREWLAQRLREGHVFRKLNAKGVVFIEYAPVETAWVPVEGDGFVYIYCLWVDGAFKGKGYGRAFLDFYECYARDIGCKELRIDTNERNAVARGMYDRRGYREAGIVPTCFNGIDGVKLVLLEKYIGE